MLTLLRGLHLATVPFSRPTKKLSEEPSNAKPGCQPMHRVVSILSVVERSSPGRLTSSDVSTMSKPIVGALNSPSRESGSVGSACASAKI